MAMPLSENLFRKDHHVYVGRGGIPLGYIGVKVTVFGAWAWVRGQGLQIASKMQVS